MLREIQVTVQNFQNPHSFWIRGSENLENLIQLEEDLDSNQCELRVTATVAVNDLIIVKDTNKYKRAVVEELLFKSYHCRLIDYGNTIITENVYELPKRFVDIPPMINLACLNNVVGGHNSFNFSTSNVTAEPTPYFNSSSKLFVEDLLGKADVTYFVIEKISNDVLFGNLLLSIDGEVVNLTDLLVKKNFAVIDKNLFLQVFHSEGTMLPSGILAKMSQKIKIENNVYEAEGIGRGCRRQTMTEQPPKSSPPTKQYFINKWIENVNLTPFSDVETSLTDKSELQNGDTSVSDYSDISDKISKGGKEISPNAKSGFARLIRGRGKTSRNSTENVLGRDKVDLTSSRNGFSKFDVSDTVSSSGNGSGFEPDDACDCIESRNVAEDKIEKESTRKRLSSSDVLNILRAKETKSVSSVSRKDDETAATSKSAKKKCLKQAEMLKLLDKSKLVAANPEKGDRENDSRASEGRKGPLSSSKILKCLEHRKGKALEGAPEVLQKPVSGDELAYRSNSSDYSNDAVSPRTPGSSSSEFSKKGMSSVNDRKKQFFTTSEIQKMNSDDADFSQRKKEVAKSFKLKVEQMRKSKATKERAPEENTNTESIKRDPSQKPNPSVGKRLKQSDILRAFSDNASSTSSHPERNHPEQKNLKSSKSKNHFSGASASSTIESDVEQASPSGGGIFGGVQLRNVKLCSCDNCQLLQDGRIEKSGNFACQVKREDEATYRGSPQPLVCKEDGARELLVVRKGVRGNVSKIEKDMAPSLLLHGPSLLPSPLTEIAQMPFCRPVYSALQKLKFKTARSMQMYLWPALMRSMSACIVSGADSGKTMCYVPAICSFAIQKADRYPFLPKDPGPVAIVLCDCINQAEETHDILVNFLMNTGKKVNVFLLIPPLEVNYLKQLKHADIIVATPEILIRILRSRKINLKRLCHLVVENIDKVLTKDSSNFYQLVRAAQSMLDHRVFVQSVQIIMTSERWTVPIENFVKKLDTLPIICIGSHLEAALYGRANVEMHFVHSVVKKEKITGILKDQSKSLKTVVVCNTDEQADELSQYFQIEGLSAVPVTNSMSRVEIEEKETMWMSTLESNNSVLICSDSIFHTQLSITTARMLIHYSLPDDSWTSFARRFKCIVDSHDSPFSSAFDKRNSCKVHIFADECCSKQFPRLYYFLKEIGTNLPEKFKTICKLAEESEERAKIDEERQICNSLKLLGTCNKFRCKQRHLFARELDGAEGLPSSGIIKFKLLRAQDVAQFGIKIVEHIDTERNNRVMPDYTDFVTEQLKRAVEAEKLAAVDVLVGRYYAYLDAESVLYRRCKVLAIESTHDITRAAREVTVKLIDDGFAMKVFTSLLVELPNEYTEFPPQSVDARLANVVPLDNDTKWNFRTKRKVEKMLTGLTTKYPRSHFVGTVALRVGGTLWLDDVKVQEYLPSTRETVTLLTLRERLVSDDLVSVRDSVVAILRGLCVKCGLELPNYEMRALPARVVKVEQARPSWAFLDTNADVYNAAYFSYAESPDRFFVRLAKFDNLFVDLQDEIQKAVKKPFYPEIKEVIAGHCYLAKDPGGADLCRVLVKDIAEDNVDCFYVDFGDSATISKDELKFLPDKLISKLPFQAIECQLYGLSPVVGSWTRDATDVLYGFCYEPDSDIYRELYVNVVTSQDAALATTKYSVAVVDYGEDNFTIINEILLDCGFAVDKEGEKIEDIELPDFKIEDDEEEEEEANGPPDDTFKEHKETILTDDLIRTEIDFNFAQFGVDFCINDIEAFRDALCRKEKPVAEPPNREQASTSRKEDAGGTSSALAPMKALPSVYYSTPNVSWYQTPQHVNMNIHLPDVKEYTLFVVRMKTFTFRTTLNEKEYKLHFELFAPVSSDVQHSIAGPAIKVTLAKKKEGEWSRLAASKEKMRNVKYDLSKVVCEDDTKKKRKFLELDPVADEEDSDGPVIHISDSAEDYDSCWSDDDSDNC